MRERTMQYPVASYPGGPAAGEVHPGRRCGRCGFSLLEATTQVTVGHGGCDAPEDAFPGPGRVAGRAVFDVALRCLVCDVEMEYVNLYFANLT